MPVPRKLIEVAFPVEAVSRQASREKSIRHGHPSTLHLWWSRKPLAAARAVLLAQLLDDPGEHPERFAAEHEQDAERARLLELIGRACSWEASADPVVMAQVRAELAGACELDRLLVWDPFGGGGSIPMEAQRLGVASLAGDLNPVSVLIQRALLELPRRWQGVAAISDPARGLAADLRHFGAQVLERAGAHLHRLYPRVEWAGDEHEVAAYLWVRTTPCQAPGCGATVPMLSNPWLDRRPGQEQWLHPSWEDGVLGFAIRRGGVPSARVGRGSVFACLACGAATDPATVKSSASHGWGYALRCVVPDAGAGRPFLVRPAEQVSPPVPADLDRSIPQLALDPAVSNAPAYGVTDLADLHLPRQRAALRVFADEVRAVRADILRAAIAQGRPEDQTTRYADDLTILLALVLGRLANRMSTACVWNAQRGLVEQTFIQNNAIAFPWDFAEANPLSRASGSWPSQLDWAARVIERCDPAADAVVVQADARDAPPEDAVRSRQVVISTDPPYFDYFRYSALSDYFYAWLRPALADVEPELFGPQSTPKPAEIVARSQEREDSADFLSGLSAALLRIAKTADPAYPVTIYYAYRATAGSRGAAAWESFLTAVRSAGLMVTATWPIRTERTEGVKSGRNSLASSIVVVCRRRPEDVGDLTREQYLDEVHRLLPPAADRLLGVGVAPVDLDQAVVGQLMAVYTSHDCVREPGGGQLSVRDAIQAVDRRLDLVLGERSESLDPGTRACLEWYESRGFGPGPVSQLQALLEPVGVSVTALAAAGVVLVDGAQVRLPRPGSADHQLAVPPPPDGPAADWCLVLALAHAMAVDGSAGARALLATLTLPADLSRHFTLVHLLYRRAHRRNLPREAAAFQSLGRVWGDLFRAP